MASVFSLEFGGRKCEVVLTAATDMDTNGKIIHVKPSSGSVRPQQYIVSSKPQIFTQFLLARNLFLQGFLHIALFPISLEDYISTFFISSPYPLHFQFSCSLFEIFSCFFHGATKLFFSLSPIHLIPRFSILSISLVNLICTLFLFFPY